MREQEANAIMEESRASSSDSRALLTRLIIRPIGFPTPSYLGHKLKNGGFNYAGWLSLLPDNLLQAFNDFWGKQALTSFSAHSRRDVLNDEYLPLLLEYI